MNVLMLVSWYTKKEEKILKTGVFHNEQANGLKEYCHTAIYYPFDWELKVGYTEGEEWGVQTYRSKYLVLRKPFLKIYARLYNIIMILCSFHKIRKRFKPDIIHAHVAAKAGYVAAILGKIYNIPVVITEHMPTELSNFEKRPSQRRLAGKAYGMSSYNVCVSEFSKMELEQMFPENKFHVIYNGIQAPLSYAHHEKKFCYREGYVNAVIVAVLYDKEIKGMQILLPALKQVILSGEKIILHHIGGGKYLDYYIKMADNLGLEKHCVFHGQCNREKLYEIVKEMDFFISASLVECSGVSVQEAMILGKPVLGTRSGGVNSLVPEEAGIIVDKGNQAALENGIKTMMRKGKEFDSEVIRNYAMEHFWIENVSRQYYEVYKSITGIRDKNEYE